MGSIGQFTTNMDPLHPPLVRNLKRGKVRILVKRKRVRTPSQLSMVHVTSCMAVVEVLDLIVPSFTFNYWVPSIQAYLHVFASSLRTLRQLNPSLSQSLSCHYHHGHIYRRSETMDGDLQ